MKKWTRVNYDNKQVPTPITLQGQTNVFTRVVLAVIILIGVSRRQSESRWECL